MIGPTGTSGLGAGRRSGRSATSTNELQRRIAVMVAPPSEKGPLQLWPAGNTGTANSGLLVLR